MTLAHSNWTICSPLNLFYTDEFPLFPKPDAPYPFPACTLSSAAQTPASSPQCSQFRFPFYLIKGIAIFQEYFRRQFLLCYLSWTLKHRANLKEPVLLLIFVRPFTLSRNWWNSTLATEHLLTPASRKNNSNFFTLRRSRQHLHLQTGVAAASAAEASSSPVQGSD